MSDTWRSCYATSVYNFVSKWGGAIILAMLAAGWGTIVFMQPHGHGEGSVVVLLGADARPVRCWRIYGKGHVELDDGVSWTTNASLGNPNEVYFGHGVLVVTVHENQWEDALQTVGLTEDGCHELERSRYDVVTREYVTMDEWYRQHARADE